MAVAAHSRLLTVQDAHSCHRTHSAHEHPGHSSDSRGQHIIQSLFSLLFPQLGQDDVAQRLLPARGKWVEVRQVAAWSWVGRGREVGQARALPASG